MGRITSSYQYKNHKCGQILHSGPLNLVQTLQAMVHMETHRKRKDFLLMQNEVLTVPTYRTMGSFVKGTGGSLRPSGRVMTSIPPGHLEV